MSDPLQADRDAMLAVEAVMLSQHDPSIWELYMNSWAEDVRRRINQKFAVTGSGEPAGGPIPGAGATTPSND